MDFWDPYFKALKHVKALKGELDEHPEYTNIVQMLRIVTANATIAMTDIFGDLPYFEAGLGVDGPAYDSQKDIYYDSRSLPKLPQSLRRICPDRMSAMRIRTSFSPEI